MFKKKKKILHLTIGLDVGGFENMLLKTLPRLQNKFDNRVCCIRGRGIIGKKLELEGVKVCYLELKGIWDVGAIFRFRKVVRDFAPDLLVTYLIHADLFGRIFGKLFGIKKVVCSQRGSLLNWDWLRILDRLTGFLVDKYLVQTGVARKKLAERLKQPFSKFVVIPNGLDLSNYDFKLDIRKKKKDLRLDPRSFNIICVSNLRMKKGHEYLLKAFEMVYRKNKSLDLLIVGDGDRKRGLLDQTRNYSSKNNIFFLGQRSDVRELLRISDIFVLATETEGMSNAILEAMASGLPIVTTNIPENCELVEDGKTALLVETREVKELKNAMLKIIENPLLARKLGKEARNVVSRKYNIDMVVKKLGNFYNFICE